MLMQAGAVLSAEPPKPLTMAVCNFDGIRQAAKDKYGEKVTALLPVALAADMNVTLVERSELDKALNEQAFGLSGMVSADAAARIVQVTGAKVLIAGHIILTGNQHMVIVADIMGTDTGWLFAVKVEGPTAILLDLTSDLSAKIAQSVADHAANLVATAPESSAARIERIVKSVTGTNRPSVWVNIFWATGQRRHSGTAENEFGAILLKAGFPVVDEKSDQKAEVEIKGLEDHSEGPRAGHLFSNRAVIELSVQNRHTGEFVTMDREESIATATTKVGADRAAQVRAVDGLAERVLPLLAK